MILRILLGGRDVGGGFEVDRGTGMYLAVVWTGISLAGAVMNFTASGGNFNDLKDMDKLKASFGVEERRRDAAASAPGSPDDPRRSDVPIVTNRSCIGAWHRCTTSVGRSTGRRRSRPSARRLRSG